MDGMDGMGWDGSPGGPRYRAPNGANKTLSSNVESFLKQGYIMHNTEAFVF